MNPFGLIEYINEVEDASVEVPIYDIRYSLNDYRRYFKYEDQASGGENRKIGVCRRCNAEIPRKNCNTKGLRTHIRRCDPRVWCYLSRKNKSPPFPLLGRIYCQLIIRSVFLFDKLIAWVSKSCMQFIYEYSL